MRCSDTSDGKLPIHCLLDGRHDRFKSVASALVLLVHSFPQCPLVTIKRERITIFLDESPARRVCEEWSPLGMLQQNDQVEVCNLTIKDIYTESTKFYFDGFI